MSKLWLIVVVALLSVLGCKAQTVQVRFAREFNCPQGSVQTVDLGGGAYRASGCGRTVTYSCEYNESGWGREIVCRAEGEGTVDPSWGQPRYTPPQTQYQPPPPQPQYVPPQPQYVPPQPQYVEPPPPPPPTYVPPQTQYVPPSQPVKPEDFPPPEAAPEERYRGAIVTNLAEMIVTASLMGYGKWSVDILQAVGESGTFQLQYTPFFSWYRDEIDGGWDPSVGQMTYKYFGYGGGAAIGLRVTPLTERGLDSLFLSLRVPLGYMSVQGDICAEYGGCTSDSIGDVDVDVLGGFHTGVMVDIGWTGIWSGFMLNIGGGLGLGYYSGSATGAYFDWEGVLSLGYAWTA